MKNDAVQVADNSDSQTNCALIRSTADIVAAMLDNGQKGDVKKIIRDVYQELATLSGALQQQASETQEKPQAPRVSIKESIQPDYIICLEDGKKLKMLKRYLKTHYDMTPEQYRKRWKLPSDYPMVAPEYAKKRSQLAHKIGLGKKRTAPAKRAPLKTGPKRRTNKS